LWKWRKGGRRGGGGGSSVRSSSRSSSRHIKRWSRRRRRRGRGLRLCRWGREGVRKGMLPLRCGEKKEKEKKEEEDLGEEELMGRRRMVGRRGGREGRKRDLALGDVEVTGA
jgi:hypothetical protein